MHTRSSSSEVRDSTQYSNSDILQGNRCTFTVSELHEGTKSSLSRYEKHTWLWVS